MMISAGRAVNLMARRAERPCTVPQVCAKEADLAGIDTLGILFAVWAICFQVVLIVHFALRKWVFDPYIRRFGWIVYALSVPAVIVSVILLVGGKTWSFWIGGFIYLVFAGVGYTVEYRKGIQWRNPPRWSILVPYVFLYLATVMLYWWPLGLISRSLWYVCAALFVVSTVLNISSHKPAYSGRNESVEG
jgi:hypothetical protein